MNFEFSDQEPCTPDWAESLKDVLGYNYKEELEEEHHEQYSPEPFTVRLNRRRSINRPLQPDSAQEIGRRKRFHRIKTIKRKPEHEIKVDVLNEMANEHSDMMMNLNQNKKKLIFVSGSKVLVIQPQLYEHRFYLLSEQQYEEYSRKVKEEIGLDREKVDREKRQYLEQANPLPSNAPRSFMLD